MQIINLSPDVLTPYENNAKTHPPEQIEQIANSLRRFGFRQPLVIDADNVVVVGHGRLLAAQKLGMKEVPCVRADDLSPAEIDAYRLADNKTNESPWDFAALEQEMAKLGEMNLDFDMQEFGFEDIPTPDLPDTGRDREEAAGSLASAYLVPPFSVIAGNKGDWLARKRAWVKSGLRSDLGRGGGLCYNSPDGWKDNRPLGGALTDGHLVS